MRPLCNQRMVQAEELKSRPGPEHIHGHKQAALAPSHCLFVDLFLFFARMLSMDNPFPLY